MPENRLTRRIIEKLYTIKVDIPWFEKIKEDIKDLGLTTEGLRNKSENYIRTIKDKNAIL